MPVCFKALTFNAVTMLPSSVRRVVSTAPQAPAAVLSNLAPRAAATFSLSRPGRHQRRCSSSKPSSPNNGSDDLSAGQSSTPATRSRKTSTETRGRKPKNAAQQAQKFPSVPTTQHMPLETLALSSFFSQHRPMSITSSLPKTVSDESFAALFKPTTSQKTSNVINTLSRTVSQLEGPMASMTIKPNEADQPEDNVHKIDVKHADGTESSVYVQLNSMSGEFLPYRPPPAPAAVAAEAAEESSDNAIASGEEAAMPAQEEHRRYEAVFTIEEQVGSDGEIKVVAHSPRVLQEPEPARTFLERMAVRYLRYEDAVRQRDSLQAISVRRIRKLRMKKKKYKKLMKKTRNARRKLDRT